MAGHLKPMQRWAVLSRGKEDWDVRIYGPYKTQRQAIQQANALEAITRRNDQRTISYHEMHR